MNIAFRLDVSENIGKGHWSRCICLSEALINIGCEIEIVTNCVVGNVIGGTKISSSFTHIANNGFDQNVAGSNYQIKDAKLFLSLIDCPDVIVLDHYLLNLAWLIEVRKSFPKVKFVIFDDGFLKNVRCDVLINSNGMFYEELYFEKGVESKHYLLGNNYSLVNQSFLELIEESLLRKRSLSSPERLLVCFGGSDVNKLALLCLSEKLLRKFLEVRVICADGGRELIKLVNKYHNLTVLNRQDNMAEQLCWADITVGAAGSMCWEYACMGLPSILVGVAKNQDSNLMYFSKVGTALTTLVEPDLAMNLLNAIDRLDKNTYQEMVESCVRTCDGQGARRIAIKIRSLIDTRKLVPVRESDKRDIFDWQSEDGNRAYSHNSEKLTWEEHNRWFKKLSDAQLSMFFVIRLGDLRCGFIRLTPILHGLYLISILIGKKYQGLGLAFWALKEVKCCYESKLVAEILPDNKASLELFKKAGFNHESGITYKG